MDVTPDEARSVQFKEGLRGYNRDQVDDFLDRVAGTIDSLHEALARAREQISRHEGEAAKIREEQETVQRTLLTAQRAADQTLAEARSTAQDRVGAAERQAAEIIDAERRRVAGEMAELVRQREQASRDVAALEEFEGAYRARLRGMIESDLAALERRPSLATESPTVQAVTAPAEEHLQAAALADRAAAHETVLRISGADAGEPQTPTRAAEPLDQASPPPGWGPPNEIVVTDEPLLPSSLTDEQFLSALREAQAGEPPLVGAEEGDRPFDQDEASRP